MKTKLEGTQRWVNTRDNVLAEIEIKKEEKIKSERNEVKRVRKGQVLKIDKKRSNIPMAVVSKEKKTKEGKRMNTRKIS